MSTAKEQSETNFYAYDAGDGILTRATYRKNLIIEIQDNHKDLFDEFNPDSINDSTFRKFVAKAEDNGITIYRMLKL